MSAPTAADHDEAMVRAMCAAADAGDAERFASFFAETAVYRFANQEPIIGRAAIARATASTVGAVWPVHHEVNQVAKIDSQLFCRFTIEAEKSDGTKLAMPCVTVIELYGGLIVDYRVHMDISPALRGVNE